ncbi:tetratricopeptide repeat protein [Amycolatopsis sp. A133]|uniref:tetratricopeptide repeat protein n=1 Tax=Amycolatopsis sp. A133 TaxID=3064472 RepID=UPI0027EFFBFC|nr:tetratricopeptide repeat protein [Amycolatopsis sp. A133]MDQ7810988.1 tetratricopeptide repeat protein [Amycolatopsis sp. A133]
MFISGLVGWLIQEAGGSGVRRWGDPVHRALDQAIREAVPRAVDQVYSMAEQRAHTVALLLEYPPRTIPEAGGVPLSRLADAVRLWVAATEYPIGADGRPEHVDDDHPLIEPLCTQILAAIRKESTFGRQTLSPLWNEYLHASTQDEIDRQVQGLHADLRGVAQISGLAAVRPERIEYWHTPVVHPAGFVGRGAELALLAGTGPVHLVHGIGGVGKTALVLEHARRIADQYPDGQVFIDFRSCSGRRARSADEVLADLLPHCGVDGRHIAEMSLEQRETAWKRAIAGRRMLFVWDNVGDVEQVRPLLSGQPGCLTLLTSRTELDLAGASTLPLAPLDEADAVKLFRAIAAGEGSTDLESEAVRLCAWMPLQIGVHAASVRRKRTLAELVTELRALPSDQRLATLFASFDLTYRSLSEDERRALRVLGTNPGPHLTAGTAAAMMNCSATDAVRLLDELVDANFVARYRDRFDRHSGGVEIPPAPAFYAYVMHDVLRDYAHHKATGLEAEFRDTVARLLDHYREWSYSSSELVPAWIQAERACLLAALRLPVPPDTIKNMALDIGARLSKLGWYSDGETAYCVGLGQSWKLGDRPGEAEALLGLADCALLRAQYDTARVLSHRALAIQRELGDQRAQAQAHSRLSSAMSFLRDTDAAESHLREALAIYRQLGDRRAEAETLLGLARMDLSDRMDDPTVRKRLARLSRLGSELGDRRMQADALLLLGFSALLRGSAQRAADSFRTAYRLFTQEHHRHGQANALHGLGQCELARDDHGGAGGHFAEAIALYREIGDVLGEIKSLISIGQLALETADLPHAEGRFREAYELSRRTDTPQFQAKCLEGLALVARATGDHATACSRLRTALRTLPPEGAGIEAAQASRILMLLAELGCSNG